MKKLLILFLLISTIAFSQNDTEIDIKSSEKILIGEWKFIKTVDKNGEEVKKINLEKKGPNGKPVTLIAIGPDIIINSDRTYLKVFTPENSDTGVWRIKSNNEIEYEIIIPENSRQGKLIVQTQKFFPDKKWRKDNIGNFLDASSDQILELTETEMKIKYEKDYALVYNKIIE